MSGTKIVPGFDLFLLHIQDAGYKFDTAPFSSRPGGYKGVIDRKIFFFFISLDGGEYQSVFSKFKRAHLIAPGRDCCTAPSIELCKPYGTKFDKEAVTVLLVYGSCF